MTEEIPKTHVRMVYFFLNEKSRDYEVYKIIEPFENGVSVLHEGEDSTRFYGEVRTDEHETVCVLHREDGPAMVTADGVVFFFIKGIQTSIEELPCDDMTKTLLKLKYGESDDKFNFHPMYKIHTKPDYEFT